MARKIIIGVIGATHRTKIPVPEEVLELAQAIGLEIGSHDAILMTGGRPATDDRSVKSLAMLGCDAARKDGLRSGRMISILPGGRPNVETVPGTRRVDLQTALSPMGRNPITGAAPDVLIVLQGGVGTLVELAFALQPSNVFRAVFVRSLRYLQHQNETRSTEILEGIRDACTVYGFDDKHHLPRLDPAKLRVELSVRLANAQDVTAQGRDNASIAVAAVRTALSEMPDREISAPSRFQGIPPSEGRDERLLKSAFEAAISKLSALKPGAVFEL